MAAAELSLAPRTVGRARAPLHAEFVRELGPGDLALMASGREVPTPATPVAHNLRERHHALARCLAQGMKPFEAAAVTGFTISRISIFLGDPTFRALVHHYKNQENALLADFMERATTLTLTAINTLQDDLENTEAPLPASMRLEIAKFAADRTGHAPVQKTFNINANVDLGSRLSEARKRLATVVEAKRLGGDAAGSATG